MDWMLDTNILAYFLNPSSPYYHEAQQAVRELNRRKAALWITPQNLTELYATLTRPTRQNGLGKSSADALIDLALIKNLFPLLEDSAETFAAWEVLIAQTGVIGRQCYDIRLAAVMQVYGITNMLTKNVADFALVPGIRAVAPANV